MDETHISRRQAFVTLLSTTWILLMVLDYYFQFFRGHMWKEHALPFLKKFL